MIVKFVLNPYKKSVNSVFFSMGMILRSRQFQNFLIHIIIEFYKAYFGHLYLKIHSGPNRAVQD